MAFINDDSLPGKIFNRHASFGWAEFLFSEFCDGFGVAMAIVGLGIPCALVSLIPDINLRSRSLQERNGLY